MIINQEAKIAVLMGSKSDWPTMEHCIDTLSKFNLPFEVNAISAHRCHEHLATYIDSVNHRPIDVIICAAGGAAHLAGVVASKTTLPILGVPMDSKHLQGMDSLLSTVQMPADIPVATFAIGKAGAINAALFAVSILATNNPSLKDALTTYRHEKRMSLLENTDPRC